MNLPGADHILRSGKITALQLSLLYQFLNSPSSINWITAFYPHFSLKRGETHGTILGAQQTILANLQTKLRISGDVDSLLSKRCIDKCSRLLLDATQKSLRMELFHSGPTAKTTLEKKLRLSECYLLLSEIDAAQEIASEAFETAYTSLGRLHPLTLQLERCKLYTQARQLERLSTLGSFNFIPDFLRLVEDHVNVFGADCIETIGCRIDLAIMHLMKLNFDEARKILEPLHRRATEILGRSSRVTHSIANNLSACANMQGDYDYAESVLYTIPGLSDAAAEHLEIDITMMPVHTLHALSIFAAVLGARDEDRRSEILHQRVIDGLTVQAGPRARRVYESAINKGQALRDQFMYGEARKHFMVWLKKADHDFGADSQHSRDIRERLINIEELEKKWNVMSEGIMGPHIQEALVWRRFQRSGMLAIATALSLVVAIMWGVFLGGIKLGE